MSLFKKILCPVEFNEMSLKVADQACELAEQIGAEVTLLHVIPRMDAPSQGINQPMGNPEAGKEIWQQMKDSRRDLARAEEKARQDAEARLQELVIERWNNNRYKLLVLIGEPEKRLHDVSRDSSIDLVVVAKDIKKRRTTLFGCPVDKISHMIPGSVLLAAIE